jgi:hypothetical protein
VVWEGRSREAPPYPDRSDFVLWHLTDLFDRAPNVRCSVESRCARYAVRCPVIPEADFVFDSRDVRLLVSPDRGSAARLGLQTRGHFVTQFTFISEFGNKGAALSDEMGPSTALTQGTLGDECTRQHHPLHHHDGDRRVRRT